MNRVLRIKMFLGSTVETVEGNLTAFLESKNLCVGNFVDVRLYKLGQVYQLILVYAELI